MMRRDDGEHTRRMELASFLRSRRERLRPEHVGLPLRPRRRTPGLRREEVAELIGIGVTWYTWLEQARPIHVSADVLEQVARVFGLSSDERAYLFQLAQRSLPPAVPEPHEVVRPVFRDVLSALEPSPAHIRDRSWNVLAWNRAETCLVDWQAYAASERNIIWHHFTNPRFRQLMVNWDRETRSVLSEFRLESGQHAEDGWLRTLIGHLHEVSAEFRAWWPLHEVRRERELPIEFQHPDVGRLILQPVTVVFTTEPQLAMRILMPLPEADTAAKLHALMKQAEAG
ncbi:MAG TPA: helix-turn-helix transcriptional regulator [Roseiflexaceae bacterium]|nr:helix-turn-helix transcriptional regulator [Roseiflexaceae bacterium]